MAVVQTLIGNVKGPQGDTGATGATGAAGAAATIEVGTVSTTAYGNPAQVTNSGTSSAAVFDFVIPQGQPGEEVTDMSGLILGTMTTQTAEFPTPAVNDTGATLWGKVVKYFSDLRTLIGTKLNTANVVNNLTTTESGYALDARQGKALNDNLTKIFKYKIYSASFTISGNSSLTVTASDLGISTPSGYTPAAIRRISTDQTAVAIRLMVPMATGTAGAVGLINTSSSSLTGTVSFHVLYVKSEYISEAN